MWSLSFVINRNSFWVNEDVFLLNACLKMKMEIQLLIIQATSLILKFRRLDSLWISDLGQVRIALESPNKIILTPMVIDSVIICLSQDTSLIAPKKAHPPFRSLAHMQEWRIKSSTVISFDCRVQRHEEWTQKSHSYYACDDEEVGKPSPSNNRTGLGLQPQFSSEQNHAFKIRTCSLLQFRSTSRSLRQVLTILMCLNTKRKYP